MPRALSLSLVFLFSVYSLPFLHLDFDAAVSWLLLTPNLNSNP